MSENLSVFIAVNYGGTKLTQEQSWAVKKAIAEHACRLFVSDGWPEVSDYLQTRVDGYASGGSAAHSVKP